MENWTLKKVLDWAISDFRQRNLESPRLEAELLLAHTLNCERISLYTGFDRPLDQDELASFKDCIRRRRQGEASAYITGSKEFWSLDFEVSAAVLIPRPDTETLVEAALDRVSDGDQVLDLCTGSGCVAITLAKERSTLQIDASDVSDAAVEIAKRNVKKHNMGDRVKVHVGDLFAGLEEGKKYHMIVSNPPYVIGDEIDTLAAEVRAEPRLALDGGGADGLDVIKQILRQAKERLHPDGKLLIELDPRQAENVVTSLGPELFGAKGQIIKDLTGRARVVVFSLS